MTYVLEDKQNLCHIYVDGAYHHSFKASDILTFPSDEKVKRKRLIKARVEYLRCLLQRRPTRWEMKNPNKSPLLELMYQKRIKRSINEDPF